MGRQLSKATPESLGHVTAFLEEQATHFYPETRSLVLDGELDFCIDEEAHAILKRLTAIAEQVGAAVEGRIAHGGCIKVYPAYSCSYYVLEVYEKLDKDRFPIPFQYAVSCVKQLSKTQEIWFNNPCELTSISIKT